MHATAIPAAEPADASLEGVHSAAHALAARHAPERLEAVVATGLLDSPAEPGFDSLTATAARLLGAAACFISVVDGQRDFYKSQSGFPEALARAREMEGLTFCHFTLDRDDALVIRDTHAEPQWRAVPTVESLGVRAYVGVPLKAHGQNIGSFCVIDMRPRAWTDDELETIRQLAVSAARELDLRTALAAAQEAAATARAQALARERVLAVVAHDLRTPLQVLQLSATQIQRCAAPPPEAIVQRMLSAVGMMASLVEGLLRPSDSASTVQALPLATLATDAVEMMAPIAEKCGIALVLGPVPDALVRVDYGQMVRVLGNLIGNSLKYSPEGSTVRMAGTCSSPHAARSVELTVADNGMGMAPEEVARAFEPGWQGETARARKDGVGLGLGIVKSLVESNRGQVRMESRPGQGTSVTITLPRA
ncbi:GAF sensor signal transduction histidine kinase [Paracidovorax avenae ATCC 19860]|uniref:histidine kinase n=1 Tax=Paracidovorax avenae (strain ATCC 19860 / DSM 7227 / CCUG 15838 / JCM 20985 / LMG 2117 / NCPPB 1011) TaxID=643561 RepID=F0Q4U4_PARA1|nr:GAF domain-containing sensor histidine kinase [Paracidovorax avenae]ADX46780.1 GAF sensor signal transduction histidine kinase [Paracidovorax avenae ATCC 19860]AVS66982.1 histidine kinase [Paracidovorax avenae]